MTIIIKNRIEYIKYKTELEHMAYRPATIDYNRWNKVEAALKYYEAGYKNTSDKGNK